MPDLSTEYLGLKLKNPIVVSSSNLTNSVKGIKLCENHGAAAVVLKSLFEEQIEAEIDSETGDSQFEHPEAYDYIQQAGMQFGQDEYLHLIKEAKKECSIPIIASLNCIEATWWETFATHIEKAGADALELNIAIMPRNFSDKADHIENRYKTIVEKVTSLVSIPVAVKIGPYFTSLPVFTTELEKSGAAALVLFNRFYQPDFDIEALKIKPAYRFSHADELALPLRWISILYHHLGCELSASTGVHEARDVIKVLLAGASTAQVCSVLYREGVDQIEILLKGLEEWMEKNSYSSLADFRGKMSQKSSDNPEAMERVQYIKALTGTA